MAIPTHANPEAATPAEASLDYIGSSKQNSTSQRTKAHGGTNGSEPQAFRQGEPNPPHPDRTSNTDGERMAHDMLACLLNYVTISTDVYKGMPAAHFATLEKTMEDYTQALASCTCEVHPPTGDSYVDPHCKAEELWSTLSTAMTKTEEQREMLRVLEKSMLHMHSKQ